MGTTLQGKKIKDTYKSIIKVTDNGEAGSTGKQLSDGNGNDLGVYVDTDGVIGVGAAASVAIDASSKTDAIQVPNGTTAQRPTAGNGMIRYNSTLGKIELYDGNWKNIFTENGGTISGDLTVTGDLTIQGTSTTVSSETVTFEDNILLINKSDSADTPFNTTSSGIEIEKTGTNPSFIHTFSDSLWTLSDDLKVEGNFGVGTNPTNLFHLKGSNNTTPIKIEIGDNADFEFGGNSSSSYRSRFYMDDTSLKIGHNSSGRDLSFQTNDTDRLLIKANGDVEFKNDIILSSDAKSTLKELHYGATILSAPSGQTATINFSSNVNFKINGSGAFTVATSNVAVNTHQSGLIIFRNTGTLTSVTLPSKFKTPNGDDINFVLTQGAISLLSYHIYDGDNILVNYIGDFS